MTLQSTGKPDRFLERLIFETFPSLAGTQTIRNMPITHPTADSISPEVTHFRGFFVSAFP
jgi:hypothetical protein